MTYSEKLKDPRWQKKRLEILNRDNWMCQECYDTKKTLHVHHLDYTKGVEPWDYPNFCLLTLCCDCHANVDSERTKWEKEIVVSLRLAAKTSFTRHCLDQFVGSDYEGSFERLIFLLFDIGFDKSMMLLEKEFDSNSVIGKKKYVSANHKCPACNSKLTYHEKLNAVVCDLCRYRPEVDAYFAPNKTEENGEG